MSFPDFVKFALICFDALAWPLFSLVYPLRASIQAIEANSNSDTKKLVTYWVIFSLISLFEHAFMGMLQWLPFWPYMKLSIVCWMMIPHFDGAFYAYNHFVHPVLYIDVKTIINWFKKQQEFVLKDNFLAEADKYIKAHGPEALEKLIASKIPETEPNAAQTVDNMITLPDIKGAAGCYPPEISSDKQVQKEWTCAMCQLTTTSEKTLNIHLQGRRHRKACEELMKAKNQPSKGEVSFASVDSVKHSDLPHKEPQKHASEPNAAQTVDDMITLPDIEGVAGCYLPEIPSDKQVQKEWTCAMCQVTTESEKTLNIHLQGRRHRKACEELMKAKNQPSKGEVSFASVDSVKHSDLPHKEPQKHASEPNAAQTVDHMITRPDIKGAAGCYPPEISSDKQVQKEWTCVMCQVTTTSEKTLNIHLEGRQHMKACEELMKAKNQPSKGEVSFASVDSVKHSDLPHKEPQKHASSTSTQASQKEQQPSVAKNYDLPSNNTSTSSKAVNPKTGTSNPNLPNEEPEKLPNDMARSQLKPSEKIEGQQQVPKKHVEIKIPQFRCTICNISCTRSEDLNCHLWGRKHLTRIQELNSLGRGELT